MYKPYIAFLWMTSFVSAAEFCQPNYFLGQHLQRIDAPMPAQPHVREIDLPKPYRVIGPDMMYTMDYQKQRLNLFVNEESVVIKSACF